MKKAIIIVLNLPLGMDYIELKDKILVTMSFVERYIEDYSECKAG